MIQTYFPFLHKFSKVYQYSILGLLILASLLFASRSSIHGYLNSYAIRNAEQAFGSMAVASIHEQKIKHIATQMGIADSIIIRKMNHTALALFGYHNAFAFFPCLLTCIPIGNQPFLFISEGFFEDLTEQEQKFIIGHELAHIQEGHTRYLNISMYALFLVLLIGAYFLARRIKISIQNYFSASYHTMLIYVFSGLLFFFCLLIPELIELAYRRHIEKVADHTSLTVLHSYDGCIALLARWQRENGLPSHNPYFGLIADHPSCNERKEYCQKLQAKQKDLL